MSMDFLRIALDASSVFLHGTGMETKKRYLIIRFLMWRLVSRVQMFKSLRCWLYQCAEGEIPDKSVLYKVFSHEVSLYLALKIVTDLPEYDKAEWA